MSPYSLLCARKSQLSPRARFDGLMRLPLCPLKSVCARLMWVSGAAKDRGAVNKQARNSVGGQIRNITDGVGIKLWQQDSDVAV